MPLSDKEKTHQYVEQMYRCDMFNETKIRKWKCKSDDNRTWALAKKYFENLFTEKQTFQDDMDTGKSGFESANNVGESWSHRLPFDGRSLGGSTIGSMPSLSDGMGGQSV